MAKIHRNGDVIIRVSDIVAAHIPSDETDVVEICTRYALANFRFKCQSEQVAKDYINNAIIAGAEYEIGHGHGPVDHFYMNR